jgi:hypothetical protein
LSSVDLPALGLPASVTMPAFGMVKCDGGNGGKKRKNYPRAMRASHLI